MTDRRPTPPSTEDVLVLHGATRDDLREIEALTRAHVQAFFNRHQRTIVTEMQAIGNTTEAVAQGIVSAFHRGFVTGALCARLATNRAQEEARAAAAGALELLKAEQERSAALRERLDLLRVSMGQAQGCLDPMGGSMRETEANEVMVAALEDLKASRLLVVDEET